MFTTYPALDTVTVTVPAGSTAWKAPLASVVSARPATVTEALATGVPGLAASTTVPASVPL